MKKVELKNYEIVQWNLSSIIALLLFSAHESCHATCKTNSWYLKESSTIGNGLTGTWWRNSKLLLGRQINYSIGTCLVAHLTFWALHNFKPKTELENSSIKGSVTKNYHVNWVFYGRSWAFTWRIQTSKVKMRQFN